MNLRDTLFWIGASSAAIIAISARAYRLFYTQENAQDRQLANRLLRQTLQSAQYAVSRPNSGEILTAIGTAGLSVLNAYMSLPRTAPVVDRNAANAPMVVLPSIPAQNSASSFEQQLSQSGYDLDNLPEEFRDPITMELMNDPVIAYTTYRNNRGETIRTPHIYDRATYNQFRGLCPENRLRFMECHTHNELRNQIQSFVTQQTRQQNSLAA